MNVNKTHATVNIREYVQKKSKCKDFGDTENVPGRIGPHIVSYCTPRTVEHQESRPGWHLLMHRSGPHCMHVFGVV